MLTQRQKNQAVFIKDVMQSAGWRAYEEFLRDFIYEYIGSSLNKDVLSGLKLSISEAKKLVETYDNQRTF